MRYDTVSDETTAAAAKGGVVPLRYRLEAFRPAVVEDLIRLGREGDGGYVVSARTVDSADVIVGLGVNTDWSFEDDCMKRRPRARLYGVDGSVSSLQFEERRAVHLMHMLRQVRDLKRWNATVQLNEAKEWGRMRGEFNAFFSRPRHHFVNAYITEHSGPNRITWQDLVKQIDADGSGGAPERIFVKMDIELAEYRVLPMMMESASRITGMAIEFHDTDLLWEVLHEQLDMLLEEFVIVHFHGNNFAPVNPGSLFPRSIEVSLSHRSLVSADELARTNTRRYPLDGLDQPNNIHAPDYPLDFER